MSVYIPVKEFEVDEPKEKKEKRDILSLPPLPPSLDNRIFLLNVRVMMIIYFYLGLYSLVNYPWDCYEWEKSVGISLVLSFYMIVFMTKTAFECPCCDVIAYTILNGFVIGTFIYDGVRLDDCSIERRKNYWYLFFSYITLVVIPSSAINIKLCLYD